MMGGIGRKQAEMQFGDLAGRVKRLEDVREALERSVGNDKGKLGVVNGETFGFWAERLNYLSDLQESLDRKTLPKMGRDMMDLDKRLNRVEHMTGPHLLVERQDKEKRVTDLEGKVGRDIDGRMGRAESRQKEFEQRITDLEREAEDKRNG